MFTGLIEDVGAIVAVRPEGDGLALGIRTAIPLAEVAKGDSIAVDGACLTAERFEGDVFYVTAGRETLQHTTLGGARPGRRVHLERALRVGDRLGGHLVQGHVDAVGRIASVTDARESWVIWIELPREIERYVAEKGSICLDGVSLTVNELRGREARVNVVPHTRAVTRVRDWRAGDAVNVEVDVLAKYVERLLGRAPGGGLDIETLKRAGFA